MTKREATIAHCKNRVLISALNVNDYATRLPALAEKYRGYVKAYAEALASEGVKVDVVKAGDAGSWTIQELIVDGETYIKNGVYAWKKAQ